MKVKISLFAIFTATLLLAQGGTPMITNDTGTPPQNGWEINIASTLEKRGNNKIIEAPLIDINYGVRDNIAVKFESSNTINKQENQKSISGVGNAETGVKWRFFDSDGLSLSTYPRYTFTPNKNSIDRGVVGKEDSIYLPIELTKEFDGGGVSVEAGYRFSKTNLNKDAIELGAVYGYEAAKDIELLCEYRYKADYDLKNSAKIVQFGVKAQLLPKYTLIASIGKELSTPEDKKALLGFFGVQMKF